MRLDILLDTWLRSPPFLCPPPADPLPYYVSESNHTPWSTATVVYNHTVQRYPYNSSYSANKMAQLRRGQLSAKCRKSQALPSFKFTGYASDAKYNGELPVEVLEQILTILSSSIEEDILQYRSSVQYNEPAIHAFVRIGLHALSSSVLVCREWYRMGISILYTRVFILSDRHLRFFARTVSKTRDLASLVKQVTILEDPDVDLTPSPSSSSRRVFSKLNLAPLRTRKPREDFAIILSSCTSLDTLSIRRCHIPRDGQLFLPHDFARTVGHTLCRLTLFPSRSVSFSPQSWLDPTIPLSALQILCLRSLIIPDDFSFPSLPHLHTLQIVQCVSRRSDSRGDLTITDRELPSLHTLELYQNTNEVTIEDKVLLQLKCLTAVGPKEMQLLSTWARTRSKEQKHPMSLTHLKSLTYGSTWYPLPNADMTGGSGDIGGLSLRCLESLYVVVWARPEYGEAWSTSRRVMEGLIRRLHSVEDSPDLKTVALLKEERCYLNSAHCRVNLSEEVQTICASRGIVYYEENSKFFTTLF